HLRFCRRPSRLPDPLAPWAAGCRLSLKLTPNDGPGARFSPRPTARLVLGMLFFIHGDQLMLGWFGGYGLSGSMAFFTKVLGIPASLAFLAICAEFLGGLMLIVGFLGRLAALSIIGLMAVAVVKVHWQ